MIDFRLDAIPVGQAQMLLAVLTRCESAGVTDVRVLRVVLQKRIDAEAAVAVAAKYKMKAEHRKTRKKCPRCGQNMKSPVQVGDMRLQGCVCGYSEVVNG